MGPVLHPKIEEAAVRGFAWGKADVGFLWERPACSCIGSVGASVRFMKRWSQEFVRHRSPIWKRRRRPC